MAKSAQMWQEARAYFEAGATQSATAEKFDVSRAALQLHIKSEGWTQDLEGRIQRKLAEKLAQKPAGADIKKTAEAIDAEANRRFKVAEHHVYLASQASRLQQQAIGRKFATDKNGELKEVGYDPDFDLQKSAKINAETVQILISLERKIHRLEDVAPQREPTKIVFARYDDGEE